MKMNILAAMWFGRSMRLVLIFQSVFVLAFPGLLAQASDHPTLPLGSPAPDFSLPGVDGRTYSLRDFADAKVFAVIFTCNHCPTAQAYEGRIRKLVAEYRERGVAFVAINPNHSEAVRLDELGYTDLDDTFESMKIRAADREFNLPYLDDGPAEAVARQYGPVATPHVFVFDAVRRLRFQGRIDDSEREELVKNTDTRNALEALLLGREPPVTGTKVFGCSIKWAEKAESNRQWEEKVRQEPVTIEAADAAALRELRTGKSGKIRVVNVWATWCGPCAAEFDDLIGTNLRFRHRDFELVTVAAQFPDEKDKVLRFLQKHHASTRNLIFGGTDKYRLMEALDPEWNGSLPHTLVLGADGEVLYRQTGDLDFLKLRRVLVPALNKLAPWGGLSPIK
ncbi:MAG TPA: redoxin domain-containing protein [Bacteroidota bacterium]